MASRYKYILFDWDGCLAKTLEVWMSAYEEVFKRYGVVATRKEIAFHFGDWEAPKYFGITDIDGCFEQIDLLANEKLKKVALYENAKNTLEDLKKSSHLALLSSSPREILEEALKFNGIRDYFEVVLAGEDVKQHKPHPEVINKGLKIIKGRKKEAVMVGDSRKDLEAAKNAGVDSVLYYPKSHSFFYNFDELLIYKPTYTASSFAEVLSILKTNR